MKTQLNRVAVFVGLSLVCVLGLGAYLYRAKTSGVALSSDVLVASAPKQGQIFFRYTGVDDNYGKLAVVDSGDLRTPRFVAGFSCEAVHFAAGSGICLSADRGSITTYAAQIFDASFASRFTLPLRGGPSRTRVSPDGKLAAFTVFLTGHGYTSLDFTTETILLETASGNVLANLEDFQVTRDGQPFFAPDFNFWGVTFTPDSRRFYCTLSSNQKHYLVQGDIAARTASVIHENVECPSVSPDGMRVAYKKRFLVDGRRFWRLHVLNLESKGETPLGEKRSVDDQIEWFDNEHVLYAVSDNPEGSSATTNVWKADAADQLPPELFIPKAYSPAVVR